MPTLKEGFSNSIEFFRTVSSLSTHLPLPFGGESLAETDKSGKPIPPENRKYMTIVEETLFYLISIGVSPALFPIIFNNPEKASGFVRQFTGIDGEKVYFEKLRSRIKKSK